MIIKLTKVISCSSEHPSYPASNLLQYRSNSSWRCAQPGCMLATVILEMLEPSCITGIDIGNYRSCVVVVSASTSTEPDNWIPIVNHQFLTHDEAANGKFRDQVEIFTKKELNSDAIKIKFDRIKVTCMQSANLKELFGLAYIVFKTEVQVDLGIDVFGRFKLKSEEKNEEKELLRDRYFNQIYSPTKEKPGSKSWLLNKIREEGMANFTKRQELKTEPVKRPLLEKLEAGKAEEVFGKKQKNSENSKIKEDTEESVTVAPKTPIDETVKRTPFGDIRPSTSSKESTPIAKKDAPRQSISKKRLLSPDTKLATPGREKKRASVSTDIPETTPKKKPMEAKALRKPFSKLFEDISFALSGYQNPRRDQIRRKALEMGAKYIADPNTTNKKCTHLICAVKNTPKYQQLKGHCKIVSHVFIEECFEEKKRFPWRRYALDNKDKNEPESEEEIWNEPDAPNVFDAETDPDSDSNY